MEREGIIERSSSEWAFPIVLVKKKDGLLRMCVDYRRLNAISDADADVLHRRHDRHTWQGQVHNNPGPCPWVLAGPRARRNATPNRLYPLRVLPISGNTILASRSPRYVPAHDGSTAVWLHRLRCSVLG